MGIVSFNKFLAGYSRSYTTFHCFRQPSATWRYRFAYGTVSPLSTHASSSTFSSYPLALLHTTLSLPFTSILARPGITLLSSSSLVPWACLRSWECSIRETFSRSSHGTKESKLVPETPGTSNEANEANEGSIRTVLHLSPQRVFPLLIFFTQPPPPFFLLSLTPCRSYLPSTTLHLSILYLLRL